jgi:hypothetical protein
MRRGWQTIISIFILVIAQVVIAQNCDALLNHGIYNIRLETSESDYQYQLDTEFCSEEYTGESTSKQKSISASYKLISGSFGSSTAQIKEYQKSYCDQRNESESRSGSTVLKTQTLYDNAIAAWSRCNELAARGLDITITISPTSSTATYGIRYTGATNGLELQGVYVTPENAFICSGQLNGENVEFGRETKAPVTNQQIAMTCERTSEKKDEFEVFQEANISIHTNDKNLDTFFPQIQIPEISENRAVELESRIAVLEQSQLKKLTGTVGFVAPSVNGVPLGQGWTLIKEECITFAQPFSGQPDVVLSTSQFDFVGGNGGLTYRVYTTSVTRDNFCYKAEGAYSTVNGFVFSWQAVGQK